MKKILLIGNSPLPTENTKSRPAAGLRTYQFLKPLIQEGGRVIDKADHAFSAKTRPKFKVCLVSIALPECYDEAPGQKDLTYNENYRHFSISKDDPAAQAKILLFRGWAFEQVGDPVSAEKDYVQVINHNEFDAVQRARGFFRRAELFSSQGKKTRAAADWQRVLSLIEPSHELYGEAEQALQNITR